MPRYSALMGLPSKPGRACGSISGSRGSHGDSRRCMAPQKQPHGFACSLDGGGDCGMCHIPTGSAAETMVERTNLWPEQVPRLPCLLFSLRSWEKKPKIVSLPRDVCRLSTPSLWVNALLWLSTFSTLSKESKAKGGLYLGAMLSAEPCPAYTADCHNSCRMACSIPLQFGSSSEVF